MKNGNPCKNGCYYVGFCKRECKIKKNNWYERGKKNLKPQCCLLSRFVIVKFVTVYSKQTVKDGNVWRVSWCSPKNRLMSIKTVHAMAACYAHCAIMIIRTISLFIKPIWLNKKCHDKSPDNEGASKKSCSIF